MGATQVEKNTVQKTDSVADASSSIQLDDAPLPKACSITDPECESCQ